MDEIEKKIKKLIKLAKLVDKLIIRIASITGTIVILIKLLTE